MAVEYRVVFKYGRPHTVESLAFANRWACLFGKRLHRAFVRIEMRVNGHWIRPPVGIRYRLVPQIVSHCGSLRLENQWEIEK